MTKKNLLSILLIIMMLTCVGSSIFFYAEGLIGWVAYYIIMFVLIASIFRGHIKYN